MGKTMKAAVLHNVMDLRYEEVEIPELGSDDVLVKVSACGVCGSDVPRVLTTGTYHFPTIPGHEFGGTVCEVGSSVDKGLLNKKVAVIPLIPCRTCELCELGMFAQCKNYDYLGSRNDGGFAEYVRVPAKNIVVAPDDIDEDALALIEPMSVALNALQIGGTGFGDNVVVYGLGAIGMFIAQWARAHGAGHVFAVDIDPRKVEVARTAGLDAVCSLTDDVADVIMKKTGGRGVDVVYEAAGAPATFNQATELLRMSGVLVLVGRPTKPVQILEKSYEHILRKQLLIKGAWSFKFNRFPHHAWETCFKAISEGKIKTDIMISHRMPLSKTMDAIRIMADKSEYFLKILIKPDLDI